LPLGTFPQRAGHPIKARKSPGLNLERVL